MLAALKTAFLLSFFFLHHFVVAVVCTCQKPMENSPIRAMGTPHCKIWTVVSTASCTPGKDTTADRVCNHTNSHWCTLELHKNLGNHSSTDQCTPPSTLLCPQVQKEPGHNDSLHGDHDCILIHPVPALMMPCEAGGSKASGEARP